MTVISGRRERERVCACASVIGCVRACVRVRARERVSARVCARVCVCVCVCVGGQGVLVAEEDRAEGGGGVLLRGSLFGLNFTG